MSSKPTIPAKGKGPSAMVRDLLARVGAPTAAPVESQTDDSAVAESGSEVTGRIAEESTAALARENARAALRRAMGLAPLPPTPTGAPTGVGVASHAPAVPFPGLAPGRNRSALAASVPVWRSDVAARVKRERAGGRCECAGGNAGWCGEGHAAGRCAVREGDAIPGPCDFPGERRVAVLVAERLDRSAPSRDPSNMLVRCPACSDAVARRALESSPAKAGRRGGAVAAARNESDNGMEFD